MARTPKWQFSVHREFNIFVQWVQIVATRPDFQRRVFGFSVPMNNYLILAGDEYADTHDTDRYGTLLGKRLQSNPRFITDFAKRERTLAKRAQTFEKYLIKSARQYELLTNKELAREYQKFLGVYIPIFGTAFVRPDDFLEQRVRTLLQKHSIENHSRVAVDDMFQTLATYPAKDANKLAYLQEPVELLSMAVAIKRSHVKLTNLPAGIRNKIDRHVERFAWLKNANLTEFAAVTRPELMERLRFLLDNSPAAQLRSLHHA